MKTRTKLIVAAVVIVAAVATWFLFKGQIRNWFAILGAGGLAAILGLKKSSVDEAKAQKVGEDAKQKILDTPAATVVAGLDADTRARIDEAKQPAVIDTEPIIDGSLDDARRLSAANLVGNAVQGPSQGGSGQSNGGS
jgi:hypothetical protein